MPMVNGKVHPAHDVYAAPSSPHRPSATPRLKSPIRAPHHAIHVPTSFMYFEQTVSFFFIQFSGHIAIYQVLRFANPTLGCETRPSNLYP
jgi:hypothetical protein